MHRQANRPATWLYINPQWGVLRSGWRVLLFISLWIAARLLRLSILKPLVFVPLLQAIVPAVHWQAALQDALLSDGLVLAVTLIIFALMLRLEKRHASSFGLVLDRSFWLELLVGALIALVAIAVQVSVSVGTGTGRVVGQLSGPAGLPFLIGVALMFLKYFFVGWWEELTFRVYLVPTIAQGLNRSNTNPKRALLIAAILTTLLFTLVHLLNAGFNPLALPAIAMLGAILCMSLLCTGRPALAIGLHAGWDAFSRLLNGDSSGQGSVLDQVSLLRIDGDFGVMDVLVYGIVFALVALFIRYRYGALRLQAHMAEFR